MTPRSRTGASRFPLPLLGVLASLLLVGQAGAQVLERFETQRLLASDGEPGDLFGARVALSNGTLVITAAADGDGIEDSGSAYILERDATGSWVEIQKLIPRDVTSFDRFGASVSLDGDTLVVGAASGQQGEVATGAAWVFERVAGRWQEAAKLAPADASAGDRFGQAVAVEDDLVLIGAFLSSIAAERAGAVYVFERDGSGDWRQTERILPDDLLAEDRFGYAIRIHDGTVAVSAIAANELTGAVYILEREAGRFTQRARLVANVSSVAALFGQSIDIDSGRVAVASQAGPEPSGPRLSVDLFERSGDSWLQTDTVRMSTARGITGDLVRLQGDRLFLGAPGLLETPDDDGAVFIFEHIDGAWIPTQALRASDAMPLDGLGNALDVDEDVVVAGRALPTSTTPPPQPVYIFDLARVDADGDGVEDARDNCPDTPNPDQADRNMNTIGDACDRSSGGGGGGGCSVAPVSDDALGRALTTLAMLCVGNLCRRRRSSPKMTAG